LYTFHWKDKTVKVNIRMRTTQKIKKAILIDLDGVLNKYNGVFEEDNIPEPKENVNEFLKGLSQEYNLILFTSRNKLKAAK